MILFHDETLPRLKAHISFLIVQQYSKSTLLYSSPAEIDPSDHGRHSSIWAVKVIRRWYKESQRGSNHEEGCQEVKENEYVACTSRGMEGARVTQGGMANRILWSII